MNKLISQKALQKEIIRTKNRLIRKNLSFENIKKKSEKIIEKLYSLNEFKGALNIMSYVSFDNEVDTHSLVKNQIDKKTIIIPYIDENEMKVSKINSFSDLSIGKFNILEPKHKEEYFGKIDIIIMPGIAFDEKGGRIGFGRGYYDKFLEKYILEDKIKNSNNNSKLKNNNNINNNKIKIPLLVALAFEEQITSNIPMEPHDKKIDIIITDKRIIKQNGNNWIRKKNWQQN